MKRIAFNLVRSLVNVDLIVTLVISVGIAIMVGALLLLFGVIHFPYIP
jgi:hypothetical protein